ncbi:MAG: YebC/PmpR family DNA-binding transcriptional regulator [Bdellovibrionaceae bacterium]|nr:YebC/PmpR family DNA-binding transcriptional regulator [Pseudobdellovibrionaceae bacterium]NUM60426.1 YebC/PmpR family DNA-binding transcriptional regulator [Pseudobdellovibrionaceae bacterium]
MGKGWKTTIKSANAQKKGLIFTKLAREIQVAVKAGGADPNMNARLRMAIDAAKKESCPNDTIERAIKKGSGQLNDGEIIEELTYEGYGPHGVGVIVECQTNNKHRTAPEMRNLFKGHEGALGETGSVAWMFDRVCLVEGSKSGTFDPEEEAIEVGANEVETTEDEHGKVHYEFFGAPESLDAIRKALTARGWTVTKAELSYKAKNKTELTEAQLKEVQEFLSEVDDFDDTHRVHVTL